MSRVIHKLKLGHSYKKVQLPCEDVKALSVGVSQGVPCLWYDRPYDASLDCLITDRGADTQPTAFKVTEVEVICVFTGEEHTIPDSDWRFLGTIVHNPTYQPFNDIVIHVYVKGF